MNSEKTLIWKKIQQKDSSAFEKFYKENYKAFFLIAVKYMNNISDAEEIVNDVFLKVWKNSEKITLTVSLKSYIYRSIINSSLNVLKKNKRLSENEKELIKIAEEGYETNQMELNELKVKLYKAIDNLPEQCQKIFKMSRFENLKQQDIADKLGISIKTVKNHITHAIKQVSKVVTICLLIFLIKIFR